MPHIVVENIVKTYRVTERRPGLMGALTGLVKRTHKTVHALTDVSFEIEPGELVGYIGPNGAGKSTTVKILSGILVPESGVCEVRGRIPWKQRVEHVAEIGCVFGQRTQLWWDLPVIESFELLREVYRIPPRKYEESRDELIEMLNLSALLDTPVRQLSLGQRMRADIAASLLHQPPILFLDEPTIGLDAPTKLAVRDFIKRLNKERGITVILTTHDMDDIEALCSRVMVINEGQLLLDGTVNTLRQAVDPDRRLIIDLEDSRSEVTDSDVKVISRDGNRVHLSFNPEKTPAADLIARISTEHAIRDLFVENPPIEEIITQLYHSQQANRARPE